METFKNFYKPLFGKKIVRYIGGAFYRDPTVERCSFLGSKPTVMITVADRSPAGLSDF